MAYLFGRGWPVWVLSIVILALGGACSTEESDGIEAASDVVGHCVYINLFSNLEECREYRGASWTEQSGREDCLGQQDAGFGAGVCPYTETLGYCLMEGGTESSYHIVFPGSDADECAGSEMGCELFGGGQFMPSDVCGDLDDDMDTGGIGSGGSVFQPGELMCMPPLGGEPAGQVDGDVCTWSSIGGCTEEGRKFNEYAECSDVLTQRPYYPFPTSTFETPEDDPIRTNEAFLVELEWVKNQAESCGCVCCHTESVAPQGASNWNTEAPGIWTDTFTELGLATSAGWVDSTALGAHAPEDNNGFDRSVTALPTTDIARMVAFFEGELARRGLTRDDFADATPIGGPLYTQLIYEPSACENGEGVLADGTLDWSGGPARYLYVLEGDSSSPGVPPNLDMPDGVLWRFNVSPSEDAVAEGFKYGEVPTSATQVFPAEGAPDALQRGKEYYLYVMKDIAIPITRCLFTFEGEAPADEGQTDSGIESGDPWGMTCADDAACAAPTDFCVKMPGAETGYCSVHCDSGSVCREAGSPADWTCNAVSCDIEAYTWCGPASEIEESGGFLSVCE
ncbi:MAG: proteinase inhibitor [Myxococcota bacterium]|nr:proteinase inhibitor [Myxococcota bacterium]